MFSRLHLKFFDVVDELVLVEGKLLDRGFPKLAALADMNAALVILHLLLRFKSLLAFNDRTLKFVLVLHIEIVRMHLFSRNKS